MKIRFVSHASFSVQSRATALLCDPWLTGKAFNRGWALLSPPAPVAWDEINYVWISHQHPDHLHFPALKSTGIQQRKRLTMRYQKHASTRIPKAYSWGWSAMEISGMCFDRRWREPNPLPFYLNVLSTDFCNFGSIRQANRTLSFLWAKRHEIFNYVWGRIPRNPSATAGELDQRTTALPSRRTA